MCHRGTQTVDILQLKKRNTNKTWPRKALKNKNNMLLNKGSEKMEN